MLRIWELECMSIKIIQNETQRVKIKYPGIQESWYTIKPFKSNICTN